MAATTDAPKAVKRRKITDKSVPASLSSEFEEVKAYDALVAAERKLDWQITRKKIEVTDALTRPYTSTKTLRVFVSHECLYQPWQPSDGPLNLETGVGVPSFVLKIQGRLLEGDVKFTSLLRGVSVHFNLDPTTYPNSNVDWQKPTAYTDQDGFTITRRLDHTTTARIALHVAQQPEKYKFQPPLADVLQMNEGSRAAAVAALWNYIKVNQLQDKADRRAVRCDAKLQLMAGIEVISFHHLQDIVDRYLIQPDPFLIYYTVTIDAANPSNSRTFDLEIETEDTAYKSSLTASATKVNSGYTSQIVALDDEIANAAQALRNSSLRRQFFDSLTTPQSSRAFILQWLTSQSKDLDLILGNEHGIREEDLKNSKFFEMDWVDDAVGVHEGLRVSSALQKLHEGR